MRTESSSRISSLPTWMFLGIGAGARPLLHTEATFRRARAFARNPQRLDCVAGVRGLELGNVCFLYSRPNSLGLHSIFVPETFRGRREETDSDRAGLKRHLRDRGRDAHY